MKMIDEIMALLPHRYPFLMIDRVTELDPGESAIGVKCVTINEPYFQGHFPEFPVMPGVLITEAFAQLAGVVALSANPDFAGKAVYLMGLDGVRFRKPVVPGDRLVLECKRTYSRRNVWKFRCAATVDGVKGADAEVMATVADKVKK